MLDICTQICGRVGKGATNYLVVGSSRSIVIAFPPEAIFLPGVGQRQLTRSRAREPTSQPQQSIPAAARVVARPGAEPRALDGIDVRAAGLGDVSHRHLLDQNIRCLLEIQSASAVRPSIDDAACCQTYY